jgi:hypothetical protein
MERVLSVDNLVGGLWRLGGAHHATASMAAPAMAATGFNRVDSELAFQEFLKKIPSSGGLAALAGSAAELPGSAVLIDGTTAANALAAGAGALLGAQSGEAPFRQASMGDFLRSTDKPVAPVKAEPQAAGAFASPCTDQSGLARVADGRVCAVKVLLRPLSRPLFSCFALP